MTDESNSFIRDYQKNEEDRIKEQLEIAHDYGITEKKSFEGNDSPKDIHNPRNFMHLSLDDLR